MKRAVDAATGPIVYVEGSTDVKYVQKAAELLGRNDLMQRVTLRAAGNDTKLDSIWKALVNVMRGEVAHRIVLAYDCDALVKSRGGEANQYNVRRRFFPEQVDHPVRKGIENLFSRETLQRARETDPEGFVVTCAHIKDPGSGPQNVPEKWEVKDGHKQKLCVYLCSTGNADDFAAFAGVLNMIAEAVGEIVTAGETTLPASRPETNAIPRDQRE